VTFTLVGVIGTLEECFSTPVLCEGFRAEIEADPLAEVVADTCEEV
jgi:hypothetical protein